MDGKVMLRSPLCSLWWGDGVETLLFLYGGHAPAWRCPLGSLPYLVGVASGGGVGACWWGSHSFTLWWGDGGASPTPRQGAPSKGNAFPSTAQTSTPHSPGRASKHWMLRTQKWLMFPSGGRWCRIWESDPS